MAETQSAPSLREALDTRVDANVWTAAQTLCKERLVQPEWLWFDEARTSFGRWSRTPHQAPYVRADITVSCVAEAVASARAEGVREGLETALRRISVYAGMTPEDDETWASWYTAAFDMLAAELEREEKTTPPTTPGGRTDG